jgi:hypothetical protein
VGEKTMNAHVQNMESFLEWVKKCPYEFVISSMQGGHVHVKFLIPYEKINRKEEDDE